MKVEGGGSERCLKQADQPWPCSHTHGNSKKLNILMYISDRRDNEEHSTRHNNSRRHNNEHSYNSLTKLSASFHTVLQLYLIDWMPVCAGWGRVWAVAWESVRPMSSFRLHNKVDKLSTYTVLSYRKISENQCCGAFSGCLRVNEISSTSSIASRKSYQKGLVRRDSAGSYVGTVVM